MRASRGRRRADPRRRADEEFRFFKCGLCSTPLPNGGGPGRPREYCGESCKEIAFLVRRLARAAGRASPAAVAGLRSWIVAEVLNRLPLDRDVLSERARGQDRDSRGLFR